MKSPSEIQVRNQRKTCACCRGDFEAAAVVGTVVALITLFQSVSHDIAHKMEKFGANIIVVPKSDISSKNGPIE